LLLNKPPEQVWKKMPFSSPFNSNGRTFERSPRDPRRSGQKTIQYKKVVQDFHFVCPDVSHETGQEQG
jgi:hypothetical protein